MTEQELKQKTRRSFLVGGVSAALGLGAFEWIRSRRPDDGVPWPLRLGLRANEQTARDLSNYEKFVPIFSAADIEEAKVNGDVGLSEEPDDDWMLTVDGIPALNPSIQLSLAQLKALQRTEIITQFKCIEGWSYIHRWAGVRFRDFVDKYAYGAAGENRYVSLETPDKKYYVGLDSESAMHPQTLLCYEKNGEPLPDDHGAPLRLIIPVKYGVKNLKRVGRIAFSDTRPPDYWAERGYDYYAGF